MSKGTRHRERECFVYLNHFYIFDLLLLLILNTNRSSDEYMFSLHSCNLFLSLTRQIFNTLITKLEREKERNERQQFIINSSFIDFHYLCALLVVIHLSKMKIKRTINTYIYMMNRERKKDQKFNKNIEVIEAMDDQPRQIMKLINVEIRR